MQALLQDEKHLFILVWLSSASRDDKGRDDDNSDGRDDGDRDDACGDQVKSCEEDSDCEPLMSALKTEEGRTDRDIIACSENRLCNEVMKCFDPCSEESTTCLDDSDCADLVAGVQEDDATDRDHTACEDNRLCKAILECRGKRPTFALHLLCVL